ncbi:MAG: high-affinity branched-chain amino acid ABC transporter ATP-binding protein LivG, partial [Thermodesulfobacteriota bacterium]
MPILRVKDMSHDFGGLRAVRNYNLELMPGQIRGLIGPNGAGK